MKDYRVIQLEELFQQYLDAYGNVIAEWPDEAIDACSCIAQELGIEYPFGEEFIDVTIKT